MFSFFLSRSVSIFFQKIILFVIHIWQFDSYDYCFLQCLYASKFIETMSGPNEWQNASSNKYFNEQSEFRIFRAIKIPNSNFLSDLSHLKLIKM